MVRELLSMRPKKPPAAPSLSVPSARRSRLMNTVEPGVPMGVVRARVMPLPNAYDARVATRPPCDGGPSVSESDEPCWT